MNKEEIDKWLDNEYGISYTRLEELHDFYFEKYCDLRQENKQLKERINKTIEYIEDNGISYIDLSGKRCFCNKQSANLLLEILKGDNNE